MSGAPGQPLWPCIRQARLAGWDRRVPVSLMAPDEAPARIGSVDRDHLPALLADGVPLTVAPDGVARGWLLPAAPVTPRWRPCTGACATRG
jgi:hypothetical protein